MWYKKAIFFIMAMFFFGGNLAAARDLEIVKDGIPRAQIIIAREADAPEIFAAEELQKYIEKMSGATLPIKRDDEKPSASNRILIGSLDNNSHIKKLIRFRKVNIEKRAYPWEDGFIIKVTDKNLVLGGSNSRSALYSVYGFLEKLGCCWLEPGEIGEVVPEKRDIIIPAYDVRERPDFDIRIFNSIAGTTGHRRDVYDWMIKNRMNFIASFYISHFAPMLPEITKRGLMVYLNAHTLESRTFGLSKDLFKEHPEYFAMVDGKRGGEKHLRPCLSNPEVIKIVAGNIINVLKKYPVIQGYSISPQDGYDGWCDCENCMKIQPVKADPELEIQARSDIYNWFVSQVIKEVNKTYPDKVVDSWSGYCQYKEVPEDVTLIPNFPNHVLVTGAYYRCFVHDIDDNDCEKNRQVVDRWKKWLKVYKRNIIVYTLCGGGVFDWDIGMSSPRGGMAKEFKFYKELGSFTGVSANWDDSQPIPSNQYVYARLLWRIDSDLDRLRDDYIEKYYQEASPHIKQYALIFGRYPHGYKGHAAIRNYKPVLNYLSQDNRLSKLRECLDNAFKAAKKEKVKERLAGLRERYNLYFNYARLEELSKAIGKSKGNGEKKALLAELMEAYEGIINSDTPANESNAKMRPRYLKKYLNIMQANVVFEKSGSKKSLFNGGFEAGQIGWNPQGKTPTIYWDGVKQFMEGSVVDKGYLYPISPNWRENLAFWERAARECDFKNVDKEIEKIKDSLKELLKLKRYKIVTLENKYIRADIIPGLGGRIYRIIDKTKSIDYLYVPGNLKVLSSNWVDYGGYEEYGASGYHSIGWNEKYDYEIIEEKGEKKIRLSCLLSNKNLLTRVISIKDGIKEIEISSKLKNTSSQTRKSRLRVHPIFATGNQKDNVLYLSRGENNIKKYPLGPFIESYVFRKADLHLPKGFWLVINEKENIGILNFFEESEIEVCYIWVDERSNMYTLELFSKVRELKPEESLSIHHKYILLDDVSENLKGYDVE